MKKRNNFMCQNINRKKNICPLAVLIQKAHIVLRLKPAYKNFAIPRTMKNRNRKNKNKNSPKKCFALSA